MKKDKLINAINGIQIKDERKDKILQKVINVKVTVQYRKKFSFTKPMAICLVTVVLVIIIIPYIIKNKEISDLNNLNSATVSLKINELAEEPINISFGDILSIDDFVPMTETELLKYYGVSIPIEEVLPSLKKQRHKESIGIYKSESRGIYFDSNAFSFESEDGLQKLTVVIAKGSIPYTGFTNIIEGYDPQLKQSEVNGVEMTIAHYMDSEGTDKYYAEFMFNGNGYKIYAQNVSLEEFTKSLVALVG